MKQPRVITNAEAKKLWNTCQRFIHEQVICHPETIYQCDRVVENALEFIEEVCKVVGYEEFIEDDDD